MRRSRSVVYPIAILFALLTAVVTANPAAQIDSPVQDLRSPKPLAFVEPMSDGPVYVVPVHGMIDNMLARYIDRALSEAEAENASLVVFHVDTFGGLVAAADLIRQRLLNATVPTVAFIDKNAASAGALISYSADRIVMVPGSSIGAATVVDGVQGEAAPDKYQSYMRGLMRSTAEARDRDPRIAEAMVDERLDIEGVSPAGQVLTLSYREALDLGVADAILPNKAEVIEAFGVGQAEIVDHRATRAERVLRFFGSPMVQSILILMMLGGLYFELQTPGVGFAGAMAFIGAAAFFAPHYMLGLVDSWEVVLFMMGVALILAEVFILPGFGIAGISGAIMVIFALGASMVGNVGFQFPTGPAVSSAIATMAVTLVLLVALIFSLSRYLPQSERFHALVLAPELTSATGYTSADTVDTLLGSTGRTLTPLRPSGTAAFGDDRVDVIAVGEYIPAGAPVRVTSVRGSRVEVRTYEPVTDEPAGTQSVS
jgi:membrane-bound serine protease (ClpP class)